MPSITQDIDVFSPLVTYVSGPWTVGGKDGDKQVVNYDQHTFTICAGPQCLVTINFHGTEVHFIGAWRSNSGSFQAVLDGQTYGPFGPPPFTTALFKVDMFSKTNLESKLHTLTLSNVVLNDTMDTFNVDHFIWTTSINSTTDSKIQDTDFSYFSYEGAWSTELPHHDVKTDFDGGTGHFTSQIGASASLTFQGDRVALYGAIGSEFGLYTVQLDGGNASSFSAAGAMLNSTNYQTNPPYTYLPRQMLFYADNLSGGNHTLIFAVPPDSIQTISVDYAIVDGTLNSPSLTVNPNAHRLSSGALAGIIVAAVGICLGCGLLYLFYRRRRRANIGLKELDISGGWTGATATDFAEAEATPYSMQETAPPEYHLVPQLAQPSADVNHSSPVDRVDHNATRHAKSSSGMMFIHN
ncbi:hypothetical protein MVEN_01732800 [Mycena venus]|uniref:Uncharacterized protein n=1 Tax=Mycena venus TaxID=2733690 RepID=A0A8H6XMA4_9AGAR|nr:hypothetical protein MVEN_01732800 [Mycena venus]